MNPLNAELAQHEQIAIKYINPIRDALKKWDGDDKSQQYYNDLAWGSLTSTLSFDKLHPLGTQVRYRVLTTNDVEDTLTPATINGITIVPLGLPCTN